MKGFTFIGMSASGKSTVGAALAKRLGWKFVDLDKLILEKQGMNHHEVMTRFGEAGLKELEERYTLELSLADTVFAPPGSLIYSPRAMEKAKAESTILYLKVSPRTVEKRLGARLYKNGIVGLAEKGLAGVMGERVPLYEMYADLTFESGEQSVAQITETILTELSGHSGALAYAIS